MSASVKQKELSKSLHAWEQKSGMKASWFKTEYQLMFSLSIALTGRRIISDRRV